MNGDICYLCDGTGYRNPIEGAPCHECNGTGWREEPEPTDEELDAYHDAMEAEQERERLAEQYRSKYGS